MFFPTKRDNDGLDLGTMYGSDVSSSKKVATSFGLIASD